MWKQHPDMLRDPEATRVLLRQNPWLRRDQSLRFDEVAQDDVVPVPSPGASVGMSASRHMWGNSTLASPFSLGHGFL